MYVSVRCPVRREKKSNESSMTVFAYVATVPMNCVSEVITHSYVNCHQYSFHRRNSYPVCSLSLHIF